ncbi:NusG domain II-containing protein [Brevibacillus daliensis]|uniref:NusG domain II-containing protein n=1 Tax=Brevibacillus daliensis TaxID=2892995 RepID=UPI001E5A2E4B|nr:NusG domain II-containing protein [Brevibacillus daliensis]
MKRGDLLIIGVVLVVALVLLVPRFLGNNSSEKKHNDQRYALITVDNKEYKKVPLTEEEQMITVETSHGKNVLKVHNNGIEMHEADCADQVCKSFGFITEPYQTIVCLPNRVLVEIVGGEEGADLDVITK